ncbi:MAG: acyltransferase family protein [Desulfobacterales bacterium]|nr:MAG: acyltransferase family protein [Desulfobacterales bacterium]
MVLCVVLQHSSNAYSGLLWWPVADNNPSLLVEWVGAFIDAFAMPLLFYIAGYFAVLTINKKGVAAFLKGKLKRLGIPWLICIFTICPILPLVYHYTRDNFTLSTSYWNLWVGLLRNAAGFNIGIIFSMNALMLNNQFYQRYMWFLSLLLLFFFVFSAIYSLKRSWFDPFNKPAITETSSVLSTLMILAAVGLLTFFCSLIMIGAMFILAPRLSNPEPFFTLGNVIQFRPSRLFLFVIYFTFGILTFKNKWIERGKFSGRLPTWIISFVIVLTAFFYTCNLMLNGAEDLKKILDPVFFFFLNVLTITTLGLSTSLALQYWNLPTAVNQNLARNSYNMYLAHYLFVIVLQLLLLTVSGMAGLLKFGIVSVLSIICTYVVCRFGLRFVKYDDIGRPALNSEPLTGGIDFISQTPGSPWYATIFSKIRGGSSLAGA